MKYKVEYKKWDRRFLFIKKIKEEEEEEEEDYIVVHLFFRIPKLLKQS